jgi:hypothetical protein
MCWRRARAGARDSRTPSPADPRIHTVYNLTINKYHTYLVNGCVVHNAKPTEQATGGHIAANGAYIVGEVGPELFLPKYAGFVVPTSRVLQALQLASTPVNTPTLGRASYTNASTQMNFYGPQYFNVPSGMDMVSLFRGGKS